MLYIIIIIVILRYDLHRTSYGRSSQTSLKYAPVFRLLLIIAYGYVLQ